MKRCFGVFAVAAVAVSFPARAVPNLAFRAIDAYPLLNANASAMVAADLNKDGSLDLALANTNPANSVTVLLGKGDGTFLAPASVSAGEATDPTGIVAVDVDGDKVLDLVTSNRATRDVSLLIGHGDGTFKAAVHAGTQVAGEFQSQNIVAADLNHDELPDLVIAYSNGQSPYGGFGVLLNVGGTYPATVNYASVPPNPSNTQVVTTADIDGDGDPDVVAGENGGRTLNVYLNAGDGTFGAVTAYGDNNNAHGVLVGNFDAKDGLDVVMATYSLDATIKVFSNAGDGTFTNFTEPDKGGLFIQRLWDIAAADLDGDGHLDVAASSLESAVTLFFGKGDATFETPPTQLEFGGGTLGMVVGDFDKNGRPDIAVVQPGGPQVSVRLNFPRDGTVCGDANACTHGDMWMAGICGGTTVVCTASDTCHAVGTCDPGTGTCSNPAKDDGAACSDGNGCTQTDTCQAGVCMGASPVVCVAADACHNAGTCDTATGTCSSPAKADGAACSDGNACTQTDSCQAGVCTGASPVVCAAADACHEAGMCDTATGSCSSAAKADGTACSDGDACTQTDTCEAGVCTGANPVVCPTIDECQSPGTCDTATGVCSEAVEIDSPTCNDLAGDGDEKDGGCTTGEGGGPLGLAACVASMGWVGLGWARRRRGR